MSNKIKKILTVDDLVKFCQEQKFARFNSKDTGYQLAVKVPTTFEVEGSDDNHRDMTKLKIKIFHTGINRNNSKVSREAAEKAMKTIPDRPVLAAIHQLSNGDYDFAGHEIEIVHNDKTNKDEVRYIESQVGSFSSEPAFWEHDDELDKDFVCAYAYISNEYTKTAEIINRKGYTKNSRELFIDEMAYDGKEHCLDLIDFYVSGSTLLGTSMDGNEKEIGEGMEGSRADIVDFSVKNNSVVFNRDDKLIEVLDRLNTTLSKFNINESKKGGSAMNKFEELLAKYNKTSEDVTFDYEDLSDEELEAKFAEVFGDEDPEDPENPENPENPDDPDDPVIKDDNACGQKKKKKKCSVEYSYEINGETKKFSVSLQEKIYAISDLVNQTYADADNTYYGVSVYEDYVIMNDWCNNRYYKQTYTDENDVYTLTGDRVEVYAEFVTADERDELNSMRANYSELKQFKDDADKKVVRDQKEEILAAEKYSVIAEKNDDGKYVNEAVSQLMSEIDNYSLADFETQVKIIHSDFVAEHSTFSANTKTGKKPNSVKVFTGKSKPKKRYGNLFD